MYKKELLEPANCSSAVKSESIANEIVNFAYAINDRASMLSVTAESKLAPILLSDTPRESCCESKLREHPPLFEELRRVLEGINYHLDIIANTVDRAAV